MHVILLNIYPVVFLSPFCFLSQSEGFEALLETEKDKSATLVLGSGMEFKIGGEGSGLASRGVLPKGTARK
jgi:hypothetical protein